MCTLSIAQVHVYVRTYAYVRMNTYICICKLYHGTWVDQRLVTVLQIGYYPVYKWFVTQL